MKRASEGSFDQPAFVICGKVLMPSPGSIGQPGRATKNLPVTKQAEPDLVLPLEGRHLRAATEGIAAASGLRAKNLLTE